MTDDAKIEAWLRTAMSAPPPVPPSFRRSVLQRLSARRLPGWGRVVVAGYAVASLLLSIWLLRDLPPALIAGSLAVSALVATGAGIYAAKLARHAG